MRAGSLLVSIDCEGLWGVSDHVDQYSRVITTESLRWAYQSLIGLLGRVEIPATFAFVSLFAAEEAEIREEVSALMDEPTHRYWLSSVRKALANGDLSGWNLPDSMEWVTAASGGHELASHSLSHLPLLESSQPEVAAGVEMDGVARWSARHGIAVDTYVFPRNQVVDIWGRMSESVLGYRASTPVGGRVRRTIGEFNVRQKSQPHLRSLEPPTESPLAIPGGFICNVRSGPRRYVPAAVTRARWRHICQDAANTGGVAHLWLHPHNLIVGHRQLGLLAGMLKDSQETIKAGNLIAMTQRDYVLMHQNHQRSG